MYKLKGKKPELSHNLIIKYDSAEQLAVLESVWEEAVDKSYRTQDEGYFGLSSGGDCVLVWYNYEYDDTVIPFLDVFEEVGDSLLPYSAHAVYDMGKEAREERNKNRKNEKKEALDLFFSKLIIPRTKAGYTWVSFNWCELLGMGLEEFSRNYTKKEFQEVMEDGGFTVHYSRYYDTDRDVHTDKTSVIVGW